MGKQLRKILKHLLAGKGLHLSVCRVLYLLYNEIIGFFFSDPSSHWGTSILAGGVAMCAVTQYTRVCNPMLHPQPLVWGVGCFDEEKSTAKVSSIHHPSFIQ